MSGARLTWSDYPIPRVVLVKGKYSVEVSIPRKIRHLFGSGKGGTTNIRKATGTSDRAVADKMLMELGNELYAKLDQKQLDVQQGAIAGVDDYAATAIKETAKAFSYNRGRIPELKPSTDYTVLQKLKTTLDSYVQMKRDDDPAVSDRLALARQIMLQAEKAGFKGFVVRPDASGELSLPDVSDLPAEAKEWLEKIKAARNREADMFSHKKIMLLQTYQNPVVESFWQDLLTEAAQEQGLPSPVFEDVAGIEQVKLPNGTLVPKAAVEMFEKVAVRAGKVPTQKLEVLERQRQVQSYDALSISDIRTKYVAYVEVKYEKKNTQRKWIRAVDRFVEFIGDLQLSEIRPLTAYQFAQKQQDANPTVSNKSVTDYHTGMSLFLKYCIRNGYIELNPFQGVEVKAYGKPKQSWLSYTPTDLDRIFAYDWEPRERLLLNILLSTGMRASEAGSLTWERFNDTELEGVRHFSLISRNDEDVEIKNIGSARYIPLHPDLALPSRGEGRLFDYTKDDNGFCSSSIGSKINPILNRLVPHKRKSTHSLRGTLKGMLRDAGVSKEINGIYTGHGSGDVSGTAYGGASTKTRAEAIAKVEIPWLKLK